MKSSSIARSMLFLSVVAVLFSTAAYADSFNIHADATTFWDSLTVTTDPGVSITWLGTSNQTRAIHFFNSQIVDSTSRDDWDDLSYSNQMGGVTTLGNANAHSLSTNILWSAYPPGGTDWMNLDRGGNFRFNGSGRVTFSIHYSLAAKRSIDAGSLPYPFIETNGVLEADLLLYIPHEITYASDQHFMFIPDVRGSANDSLSQSGTATVQYDRLEDGGTYWIRADAHSTVTIAAPEPSSLLLLSMGLAGIVAIRLRASARE